MKKSAQKRIIIWSIVSVLIICILVSSIAFISYTGIMSRINDFFYDATYTDEIFYSSETSEKLSYSPNEISSINVNVINGDVILKASDDDFIQIYSLGSSTDDEVSNLETFYYEQDYDTITIYGSKEAYDLHDQEFTSSDFAFVFDSFYKNISKKTIVVELPVHSNMNNITLNTASAGITVKNVMNTESLTINSYSGIISASYVNPSIFSISNVSSKINLENIKADELSINNVSGDADISGDIGSLSYDGVSGNLNYSTDSLNTDSISVNTVSGNTNITLSENNGFTLNNSSLSGKIKSGFNGRTIDENYVYGDGSTEIEFNSVSGSININPLKDDKAEQEKAEQKRNEEKESSTSQPQSTIAKATESND